MYLYTYIYVSVYSIYMYISVHIFRNAHSVVCTCSAHSVMCRYVYTRRGASAHGARGVIDLYMYLSIYLSIYI